MCTLPASARNFSQISAESKVVLSSENETETESGFYPDAKQYIAAK